MAPKAGFNSKDTAATSSHKRHGQHPPMTHDNMHRHMMAPYPSFNLQDTATARPTMRMQDKYRDDKDDDEPIFVPQIPMRRAAAAAPTAAPSQQWMPAMASYDEASPSGRRTHRDNYEAARDNEQAAYDELMELYTRLRASKKRGDAAAIDAIDAPARRLHQVYLRWVQQKLEAYHELQLAKY